LPTLTYPVDVLMYDCAGVQDAEAGTPPRRRQAVYRGTRRGGKATNMLALILYEGEVVNFKLLTIIILPTCSTQ